MSGVVTVEGWPQKGSPSPEDQQELSQHMAPLSAFLEWSVEPFRVQPGSDGEGSLWVVTEVGDGEAGWRDVCQCVALGRRLSRLRPNWRWQLTDDSRQMEQRFKVCELGLKDGKIQRMAGWAAVDDVELQAEVDRALEGALGERLVWIRRGEPPETLSIEDDSSNDLEPNTVEVLEPQVATEPDPELDAHTEPNHPTVIEADDSSEPWVSLQFVKGEGPPPKTVIHRPAEPFDPSTPTPPSEQRARPHLDSEADLRNMPGAQAAEGLELFGAIQKLRGLVQHSDPKVRRQAVEVIGAMAGPAIALTLRPMLADPDQSVREAARSALLALKG